MEASQIREVVECMCEKKWKKDEFVIKEGDQGSDLYVLEGNKNKRYELLNLKFKQTVLINSWSCKL